MKRFHVLVAVGVLLLISVGAGSRSRDIKDGKAAVRNFEVRMVAGNKFDPETIEIKVGDTITWINDSKGLHTATSDDKGKTFDTKDLPSMKFSKRIPFNDAGTITYHCIFHENQMKGKVIVR